MTHPLRNDDLYFWQLFKWTVHLPTESHVFSLFSSHASATSSQDVVRKTPAQIRNEKGAEQYKASSTATMSSFLRISSRHVLDFKSFQPLLIIVLFVQPFQNDPGFNRKLSTSLVCSLSKRANNYNFNKFLRKPGQKQDPSGETREKLEKLAIQKNRLRNPLVGIDPNTTNGLQAGKSYRLIILIEMAHLRINTKKGTVDALKNGG